MFGLTHFIWIGISIVIIIGLLFIRKRFNLSFETVLTIMLVMSICSEVTKIFCNMEPAPDGRTGLILDPGDLPFHLCSIQIFFMFAVKYIKNDIFREKMIGFMVPTMILGATIALFIPTVGTEFNVVQVYQYFIYHAFLIFFSIYCLKQRFVNWSWGVYLRNIKYLGAIALVVTWINSMLSGVLPRVNFMYLVRPPMEGLPVLNLNHGWIVYFLTLLGLVFSLTALFTYIAILATKPKKQVK